MTVTYRPELSFHATLHWQMVNGQPAVHGLSATYIEQAPTSLDNGWLYASVGDTYSGLKPIGLGLDQASGRLVGLEFWFGCYHTEDGFRYELCVFTDPRGANPFQFHTVDVSRNGYLGVYSAAKPAAGCKKGRGGPLWALDGLNPWMLEGGGKVRDVTLVSAQGGRVRRSMENYFPYLKDNHGHDTLFTVQVANDGKHCPW